jgi:hypothetical protein
VGPRLAPSYKFLTPPVSPVRNGCPVNKRTVDGAVCTVKAASPGQTACTTATSSRVSGMYFQSSRCRIVVCAAQPVRPETSLNQEGLNLQLSSHWKRRIRLIASLPWPCRALARMFSSLASEADRVQPFPQDASPASCRASRAPGPIAVTFHYCVIIIGGE